jgi:hypothetical protein
MQSWNHAFALSGVMSLIASAIDIAKSECSTACKAVASRYG